MRVSLGARVNVVLERKIIFRCSRKFCAEYMIPQEHFKARYVLLLRPVHTRNLAPETRSRNTFPGKYPNQYTRRIRRGRLMMKQPDWGVETGCYKSNMAANCSGLKKKKLVSLLMIFIDLFDSDRIFIFHQYR